MNIHIHNWIRTEVVFDHIMMAYIGTCGNCVYKIWYANVMIKQMRVFPIETKCIGCESVIKLCNEDDHLFLITGPKPDFDFMKELKRI